MQEGDKMCKRGKAGLKGLRRALRLLVILIVAVSVLFWRVAAVDLHKLGEMALGTEGKETAYFGYGEAGVFQHIFGCSQFLGTDVLGDGAAHGLFEKSGEIVGVKTSVLCQDRDCDLFVKVVVDVICTLLYWLGINAFTPYSSHPVDVVSDHFHIELI